MPTTKTKTVVYLSSKLVSLLSPESRAKLLEEIKETGHKVYDETTAKYLNRVKDTKVVRFGSLPNGIETRLKLHGCEVVRG